MNNCNTDRFLATTVVCGLSTLNWTQIILVPRGCDPFGQRHGSRPLANTAVKRVRMSVVEHFRSRDVVLDQHRGKTHCA